jgi:hypothetical protein
MNLHKNARLTPQGRLLLMRRITEEGWRVADAATVVGISVTAELSLGGALPARRRRGAGRPQFGARVL